MIQSLGSSERNVSGAAAPLSDSNATLAKPRDWTRPGNIRDYIADLNRARRANPALLQTENLQFLTVDDPEVIGFVKESVSHDQAVAVAIALGAGKREFWLHFGDLRVGPRDGQRPVLSLEEIESGQRHRLEWGGVRLTIDAERDPALLFRCVT